MASSPLELTLDCKHHNLDQQIDHKLKLEDFLSRLEQEMLKIDAFKPLEASRHQLQAYTRNQGSRPVLEEFMPLDMSDHKANWMTTAQLWSQETKPQSSVTDIGPNLELDSITKQKIGGAFLPFSKDGKCSEALPELALASLSKDMDDRKCNSDTENGVTCQRREEAVIEHRNGTGNNTADGQTTNQPHRKARRCWSPDLHRRFVNALQMLGGSQVATPKLIRELMKVDGLTNDEVKSHLQKYRLHTRTPSPQAVGGGASAPQLVVLGGIWVPPEYSTAAHSGGTALYGAHHAPPHFCAPLMRQEFYSAAAALPPPQLHHQYHNMCNAAKRARSSPEPDIREAGDRSESIEDGNSESSSWKGESGGGDQRIGLVALREETEECNRCEITLKF
ncbi:hypothetical protein V6N13_113079 [Hibiscus sabdariffa]|uniref:HTH myb-type domain-containing protein n=1 Tax=Hibiscus sabdariffa TaxID=183260 RepID=A0ABR2CW45_9ROSI